MRTPDSQTLTMLCSVTSENTRPAPHAEWLVASRYRRLAPSPLEKGLQLSQPVSQTEVFMGWLDDVARRAIEQRVQAGRSRS